MKLIKYPEVANAHSTAVADASRRRNVLKLCKAGKWDRVQECIHQDSSVATLPLLTDNNKRSTVLHQAIGSKSDTQTRAAVVMLILELAPVAASIPNSYRALPLHTLMQRNGKMDKRTRDTLIMALINAYPESVCKPGGPSCRTPLHHAFRDCFSTQIARFMVSLGRQACFIRDGKGFLPIHVACSHFCSIEKLRILLEVNPTALFATTTAGDTPLSLAISTATNDCTNKLLIKEIKVRMKQWKGDKVYQFDESARPSAVASLAPPPPVGNAIVSSLQVPMVQQEPKVIPKTATNQVNPRQAVRRCKQQSSVQQPSPIDPRAPFVLMSMRNHKSPSDWRNNVSSLQASMGNQELSLLRETINSQGRPRQDGRRGKKALSVQQPSPIDPRAPFALMSMRNHKSPLIGKVDRRKSHKATHHPSKQPDLLLCLHQAGLFVEQQDENRIPQL